MFHHSIPKSVLHNWFYLGRNLVFDCPESDLPSFPNLVPCGPGCHALRNREVACLTNGSAGSGDQWVCRYACVEYYRDQTQIQLFRLGHKQTINRYVASWAPNKRNWRKRFSHEDFSCPSRSHKLSGYPLFQVLVKWGEPLTADSPSTFSSQYHPRNKH